ncbi:MAG: hypothetical protein JSW68_15210 [Burkholderiales bacterium]|nr:MAG: hypothetical protein JSW68_15210 [Burkholderiales bacterium]
MNEPSPLCLLGRYLSFVWMFEAVPLRADRLQHAAIMRRNRDIGLRYLPVYMRRYVRMLIVLLAAGTASDAMAAPLFGGAFFTLSTLVAVAWLIAGIGLAAMRLRAFGHSTH